MKKHQQLGMNAGTASHRLVKDILFDFVIKAGHKCYRCGGVLQRDGFSIEHIKPWLDSADPKKLFFDLGNIAFSHIKCNSAAKRPSTSDNKTAEIKRNEQLLRQRKWHSANYDPIARHQRYKNTGN